MGLFEHWPYTNFHDLNLDWIVAKIKELQADVENFSVDVQQYVNQWLVDNPQATTTVQDGSITASKIANDSVMYRHLASDITDIIGGSDGIIVESHISENKTDTSYVVMKLPKEKFEMEFHNCSGNDNNSPTTLVSNPLDYLKANDSYDIAVNCNYGGADYPGRLNGVDYAGTVFTRALLAYNTTDQDLRIYPAGTTITSISADYDVVYAIDETLLLNGVLQAAADQSSTSYETRTVFGYNDDYWFILVCEGRGTFEKGMNLYEAAVILQSMGCLDAYNWDGGGSCCLAIRTDEGCEKINTYKDVTEQYGILRDVGLCAVFKEV